MKKLKNIDNFLTDAGVYTQKMVGYIDTIKDRQFILQAFEADANCWYYVLIYDENDALFGVFTVLKDKTNTMTKILMARNTRIVEKLIDNFIELHKDR